MSANLSVSSSDVYAVVDKKKKVTKKTKPENDSTPFAVYSVVEKTNFSEKNSHRRVKHERVASTDEASVYSVISRENISKSICSENDQKNEIKRSPSAYLKYCIILGIPVAAIILVFIILLAIIISLNSAINNLNTKVADIESNISSNYELHILSEKFDKARIELNMQNLTITSLMSLLKEQMVNLELSDDEFNTFLNMNFSDLSKWTEYQLNNISQEIDVLNYYILANITARLNSLYKWTIFSSCREILSGPSGYYLIRLSNGSLITVFCEMMTCNGISGGWMRVATLPKHRNGTAQCFPNFIYYEGSNRTQCVRNDTAAGCTSVIFPVFGVEYSHVCGEVRAYGKKTPDGFRVTEKTIDETYVDGISLTYKQEDSRRHLWTFASKHSNHQTTSCGSNKPSFVMNNFSCMKLVNDNRNSYNFSKNFSRTLGAPTTSNIEMRVCRDGVRSNEDIILNTVEMYIY